MYFSIVATCPSIQLLALLFVVFCFAVCRCFIWRTKAELRVTVGQPQTSSSPPVILLLAVPRRFFLSGSLVVLDVAFRYISLFLSYNNIKIGKIDV